MFNALVNCLANPLSYGRGSGHLWRRNLASFGGRVKWELYFSFLVNFNFAIFVIKTEAI